MNILMMTNTYTPHVGGVARSVSSFTRELRARGHRVVVVAPDFAGQPKHEPDVVRVPAIQHFNGSDFSVSLPIPGYLHTHLVNFKPELVHSHHPFLMGSTAVRVASVFRIPLVFTHHTMYEDYTHYVPVEAPGMRQFVIHMTTGYANLCDHVVAPSESVADVLRQRGVSAPVTPIPTGVYVDEFAEGDGDACRRKHGIDPSAFVVGHLGRLAPEKNLNFVARCALRFIQENSAGVFLVVGGGPSQDAMQQMFDAAGLADRIVFTGSLKGEQLVNAYHAMDVFLFASKTETQGMVLTEAMAAGVPVVALDAPGAREVIRDGENGWLLPHQNVQPVVDALTEYYDMDERDRKDCIRRARQTAGEFSMARSVEKLESVYAAASHGVPAQAVRDESLWTRAVEQIKAEWDLLSNIAAAATETFKTESNPEKAD